MKLRVFDNRIRLRLTRGEVGAIAAGQSVEARCELAPVPLIVQFSLERKSADATIRFANGLLQVSVPAADALAWASGDAVGIERGVSSGAAVIRLTIEKDFRCLHGETIDQDDCYPNPNEAPAAAARN